MNTMKLLRYSRDGVLFLEIYFFKRIMQVLLTSQDSIDSIAMRRYILFLKALQIGNISLDIFRAASYK